MSRAVLWAQACALIPAAALACPQCAGRSGGGIAMGLLIAAMIALPFAVAGIVVRIIRRSEAERRADEAAEALSQTP